MSLDPARRHIVARALFACAVGDQLGLPFENRRPPAPSWDARAFEQAHPRWSDDTQQSLVLVDDVLRHGSLDAHRVMTRFVAMRDDPHAPRGGREGWGLHRGTGRGFRAAVDAFAAHGVFAPMPGRAGNGAAMRVVAVAVALGPGDDSVTQLDAMARATHGEAVSWHAARALALAAWAFLAGRRGDAVLDDVIAGLPEGAVRAALGAARVAADPFAVLAAAADEAAGVALPHGPGGGHALAGPLSALFLAARATSLHQALHDAVRLGGDTDSTAAMAGALRAVVDDLDGLPAALTSFNGAEDLRRWGEPAPPPLEDWWALERRLSQRVLRVSTRR